MLRELQHVIFAYCEHMVTENDASAAKLLFYSNLF
jgi:hypothetical protein